MGKKRDIRDSFNGEDGVESHRKKVKNNHHPHTSSGYPKFKQPVDTTRSLQEDGEPQDRKTKHQKNDHHERNFSQCVHPSISPYFKPPPNSRKDKLPTIPKLPSIEDEEIRNAVFTHQGTLPASHSFEKIRSYERFEFLGDAYVEVIASRVLWDRFPSLPPGQLTQIREALVKNETLCGYALEYGFDQKMKLPKDHRNSSSKLFEKTMGDVMEAYVAGIILADPKDGFTTAETWLAELWTSKIDTIEAGLRKANRGTHLGKQDLSAKIGGKAIKIAYKDEREPEQIQPGILRFHIGVYLNGWGWEDQHLGSGSGTNKTEAGNQAALRALANTRLINDIARVKEAHDAKVKAERDEELAKAEAEFQATS